MKLYILDLIVVYKRDMCKLISNKFDNNNLKIIPVISDSITRQGRTARLPLLATNQQPIDGSCAEGAKFAQDGRDWVSGSICQDLSSV